MEQTKQTRFDEALQTLNDVSLDTLNCMQACKVIPVDCQSFNAIMSFMLKEGPNDESTLQLIRNYRDSALYLGNSHEYYAKNTWARLALKESAVRLEIMRNYHNNAINDMNGYQ